MTKKLTYKIFILIKEEINNKNSKYNTTTTTTKQETLNMFLFWSMVIKGTNSIWEYLKII